MVLYCYIYSSYSNLDRNPLNFDNDKYFQSFFLKANEKYCFFVVHYRIYKLNNES